MAVKMLEGWLVLVDLIRKSDANKKALNFKCGDFILKLWDGHSQARS